MDDAQIWHILGLDGPDTHRNIKRAYAKRLKLNKPDQHPAAFKQLRTAYEKALLMASESQAVQSETEQLPPITLPVEQLTPPLNDCDEESTQECLLETSLSAVDDLLLDAEKVNCIIAWQAALAPAKDGDMFLRRQLSYRLFARLLTHSRDDSHDVLHYLSHTFQWHDDRSLSLYFSDDEIRRLLQQIPHLRGFTEQVPKLASRQRIGLGLRLAMGALDMLKCSILAVILAYISRDLGTQLAFSNQVWLGLILVIIYATTCTLCELAWRTTVAGAFARLVVLTRDAQTASASQVIWRNLLKLAWLASALVYQSFAVFVIGGLLSHWLSPLRVYQIRENINKGSRLLP